MEKQYEKIIRASQKLFVQNKVYTRKEIIKRVCNETGIPESSFLPTDYCYNLTNNGIVKTKHQPIFEQIKRGHGATFIYLGLNVEYKGKVQHFPSSRTI